MRKIIFLFLLFLGIFFWKTSIAYAQYACTEWGNCTTEIDLQGGTTTTCECLSTGSGVGGTITCSPGYYVCNAGGCCPISGGGGCGNWSYTEWTCQGTCGTGTIGQVNDCGVTRRVACALPACASPNPSGPPASITPNPSPSPSTGGGGGGGGTNCLGNGDCATGQCCNVGYCGTCAAPAPFVGISGKVYDDVNNTCPDSPRGSNNDPLDNYNGASIVLEENGDSQSSQPINLNFHRGSANYSKKLRKNTTYSVSLLGIPVGYRCSDGSGCSTNVCPVKSNVPVTTRNLDFYITNAAPLAVNGWWQVQGGNVHADNGGVSSSIPATCIGSCLPYLIARQGVGGATGLVSFTGTLGVGGGGISQDGNNWQAQTEYKGLKTDFAYFKRTLQSDAGTIEVWNGNLPAASGVYAVESDQATSGGDWNIGANEKIVLLVNGEVTIDNNINVAEGGFLAIIASGNIQISDAVTHIEGVFISDGMIRTGAGASQLTGEGIFTGWDGFSLGRDLDTNNSTEPAEKFIYRPDLQLNAYRYLMKQSLRWQEVNP